MNDSENQTVYAVPDDADLARLTQASEWLQLLRETDNVEQNLDQWQVWCAVDPRNHRAFEAMLEIWTAGGEVTTHSAPPPIAVRRFRRLPFALAACFVTACVIVIGALGWRQFGPERIEHVETFISPRGVKTIESLPDKSIIELGGQSQATVSYSNRVREVAVLSGDLFVSVAKDPKRPFVAIAGNLRVAAIGTAFNVQRSAGRSIVTVTEGVIEATVVGILSAENAGTQLREGQQIDYVEASNSLTVRWVDPAMAIAWRDGMLNFIDEPLASVIANINRYSPNEILIEDKQNIGKLAFTGTARVDRLDSWLVALESVFPVTHVGLPDGRRLLKARDPGGETGADASK